MDFDNYCEFVRGVTSKESEYYNILVQRLSAIDSCKFNVSLAMTASIGLSSETGEFSEIVKKIFFQGKPINDETRFHMIRELGDIIFYWVNACRSIGVTPEQVIRENIDKLSARYPHGFEIARSEIRQNGDL